MSNDTKSFKKSRLKKRTKLILASIATIVFMVFSLTVVACMRAASATKVKAEIALEAGSDVPQASDFLTEEDERARFVTDVLSIDTTKVGQVPVTIAIGDNTYSSILRINDTVRPVATAMDKSIIKGEAPEAEFFIGSVSDATDVKISYKKDPDFNKAGEQSLTIVLVDTGNNKQELPVKVRVLDVINELTIEAGTSLNDVHAVDFIDGYSDLDAEHLEASFEKGPVNLSAASTSEVVVKVNGELYNSKVTVVDTTPPDAVISNKEAEINETLAVEDFITQIIDESEVTAAFKTEPDLLTVGTQEVCIVLEDAHGNSAEVFAQLLVRQDSIPPTITGAVDQTIFVGDKISYKKGVAAEDNNDGVIEFTVNSNAVNPYEAGSYPVIYSATDSSGNKTSKTVSVTVIELDYDMINMTADDVLAKIITDDMTPQQKSKKIFSWVKGNVHYTSSADKSDTLKGAYYGFKNRQGDCFTFYAVSEVLLTRAGIDNMRVTRIGGTSQHFWNLVNLGEGWYHFDTCPTKLGLDTYMFTDKQAEAYTAKTTRIPNYYVYDKTLYPEVVYE